jgi:hypothetical protein
MLSSSFGRREGQEIAVEAGNSGEVRELQRKLCQKAKQVCESPWKKMIGKSRHGGRKLNVRLCVQRRLACSAGVSPAGVKARSPVAGMAERRETQYLKPIDKAIL